MTYKSDKRNDADHYELKLYIVGATLHSTLAIRNIKTICDKFLEGHYNLEIIDIYQHPSLSELQQIIAAPTLIKLSPLPKKRLIGDMSDTRAVLAALHIMK
jgi:circadian clock protein KaiB